MAIVDCPECEEEVSTEADVCPNCGYPLKTDGGGSMTKSEEQVPEEVIFEGTPPVIRGTADIIIYGGLSLTVFGLIISIPWFLGRYVKSKSNHFKITNKKIRYEHGLLSTNIDTMRLYRIKDVQYSKSLGRERIGLVSQDATTPTLEIPVKDGRKTFEELEPRIEKARRRANVSMKENI